MIFRLLCIDWYYMYDIFEPSKKEIVMRLWYHAIIIIASACDRCAYSPVNLQPTATIILFLVMPYHSARLFIHYFVRSFVRSFIHSLVR